MARLTSSDNVSLAFVSAPTLIFTSLAAGIAAPAKNSTSFSVVYGAPFEFRSYAKSLKSKARTPANSEPSIRAFSVLFAGHTWRKSTCKFSHTAHLEVSTRARVSLPAEPSMQATCTRAFSFSLALAASFAWAAGGSKAASCAQQAGVSRNAKTYICSLVSNKFSASRSHTLTPMGAPALSASFTSFCARSKLKKHSMAPGRRSTFSSVTSAFSAPAPSPHAPAAAFAPPAPAPAPPAQTPAPASISRSHNSRYLGSCLTSLYSPNAPRTASVLNAGKVSASKLQSTSRSVIIVAILQHTNA